MVITPVRRLANANTNQPVFAEYAKVGGRSVEAAPGNERRRGKEGTTVLRTDQVMPSFEYFVKIVWESSFATYAITYRVGLQASAGANRVSASACSMRPALAVAFAVKVRTTLLRAMKP